MALCVSLTGALAVPAAASAAEPQARKTLKMTSKERPGTSITEVFAETIVAASPEAVYRVISDFGRYPQTMPSVKSSRRVAVEGEVQHWYFTVDVPVIHDRDYTLRLEPKVEGEKRTLAWTASKRGPAPVDGYVRVHTTEGHWEVTPVNGGELTRIRYRLFADPAGNVPRFLANKANRDTIPDIFAAVEREARRLDAQEARR